MTESSAPLTLMAGAEPFRFDAPGDVACILSHGFTSTSYEIRQLGMHLAAHGITARGILLSGHGTRPEDMVSHGYQQWVRDFDTAVDELLDEGKRVFVGGLSMGGTLALNVAARRRHDPRVLGVICLAGLLRLADWRLSFLPIGSLVIRWINWGKPDIRNEAQGQRRIAYTRFPVRSLSQLTQLLEKTRQLVPAVHQPLLVVHGRHDRTVTPSNAELIIQLAGSQQSKLVWLDNSGHLLTLDYDSEIVHHEIVNFIELYS